MTELGMKEGFDIGLEMSGAAAALRSMVDVMAHGGEDRPAGAAGRR